MTAPARGRRQRRQDTLDRLAGDVDLWVATADPATGTPHLVPLSYLWDGATLLIATVADSPTGRNLRATGRLRLGVGGTRDVVLIDGTATTLTAAELPTGVADAFAARTGFDPREDGDRYRYFQITPDQVRAWREANELAGRLLMRDGRWTDDAG
jgi:hypothetical protein